MRSALTCLAVFTIVVSACDSAAVDPEGVWELEGFTVGVVTEEVVAGINTAQTPWVSLESGEITGNAGCNQMGGTYEVSGATVAMEIAMTAKGCGLGGGLMRSEQAVQDVVWAGDVEVSIGGGRMVWAHGGNSLVFGSIEAPPTTQAFVPPPASSIGRLDCAPRVISERIVPDTGQEPLEIAQDADPSVVTVDSSQPLWYSGLDAAGRVIVEMALGDAFGADYQVWTCSG